MISPSISSAMGWVRPSKKWPGPAQGLVLERGGGGGSADDQLGLEEAVLDGGAVVADALDQGGDRAVAELDQRLAHRRQGRGEVTGAGGVVDADDGEFFTDFQANRLSGG